MVAGGTHATYPWSADAPPEIRDCMHPWERIDVTNAGDVLACCFAQEPLGSLHRQSLQGILGGKRRRILQDDVRRNRINPACFNAACLYAHTSVRRSWQVWFSADRFRVHGVQFRNGALCLPWLGNGPMVQGPFRYLPAAAISAKLRLKIVRIWPARRAKPEEFYFDVVDDQGKKYADRRLALTQTGDVEVGLDFRVGNLSRSRFSFRIGHIPNALRFYSRAWI